MKEFIIVGLTVVLVTTVIYRYPYYITDRRIDKVLTHVKSAEFPDNVDMTTKDGWGKPLRYRYEVNSSRIKHIVTSRGPDKILGTKDDIAEYCYDFDRSRILGEWAGRRLKQGLSGFVEGLTIDSRFEKEK